ncbi:unnamed protein product [Mesocestoides corti]|uniref:Secreted protein n=1 Tax=Mesocestoides corti TaxID=53468 RepID=A0A0R3U6T7_MESCO|nr:unnamed protein product [Mesocestoides corti]
MSRLSQSLRASVCSRRPACVARAIDAPSRASYVASLAATATAVTAHSTNFNAYACAQVYWLARIALLSPFESNWRSERIPGACSVSLPFSQCADVCECVGDFCWRQAIPPAASFLNTPRPY